jgi:hypothetical protein
MTCRAFVGLAVTLMATVGCTATRRALHMGGGCADEATSRDWITRTAMAMASGGGGPEAARMRSLAGAPLHADSIRVRLRLVREDAVCRAVGGSSQAWRASDRYVVLQLGRMYWVRGTSWHYTNAVDDRFHRIVSLVDMD